MITINSKILKRKITLYYEGNINLIKSNYKRVAIIGTRFMDCPEGKEHIKERIYKYVSYLKKENQNVVILSGLAIGCDSFAHNTALDIGLPTIAVTYYSPNKFSNYKSSDYETYKRIRNNKNSLIITEYNGKDYNHIIPYIDDMKKDTDYSKIELNYVSNIIQRDYIQALLSDEIVLAASSMKGDRGSRYAMLAGTRYGKKVTAFKPDNNESYYDMNRYYDGKLYNKINIEF